MIQAIIRFLTNADFFNIYKPSGTEDLGGGQSYIDFPTRVVSIDDWHEFFEGVTGVSSTTKEMLDFTQINWNVPIISDGDPTETAQMVKIYRRRKASICIASQKITSSDNNRIHAWLPQNGFPEPSNPANRRECPASLCIILYRTGNSVRAGWRLPATGEGSNLSGLTDLITCIDGIYHESVESAGTDSGFASYLQLEDTPFEITVSPSNQESNDQIDTFFLDEDSVLNIDELADEEDHSDIKQDRIVKYRKRNQKIVYKLKELYNGECQVSGTEHTFQLSSGQYYSEAHHLVPLGEGGSDNAANVVIVSPTVHRMLHSIKPVVVDFSLLQDNQMPITVGGKTIVIHYNEKHAELVNKLLNSAEDSTSSQS